MPARFIPLHAHGCSKYYRILGCIHPLCVETVAKAQARVRANRRIERHLVDGRMVHPGLAAADSDSPRRHGTQYARSTFGCECLRCKPDLVAFPGTSLLWHGQVDPRVVSVAFALAVLVAAWHVAPVDFSVFPHLFRLPRVSMLRVAVVALTAYTAAPLVTFVVVALVVAAAWSLTHRERDTA